MPRQISVIISPRLDKIDCQLREGLVCFLQNCVCYFLVAGVPTDQQL